MRSLFPTTRIITNSIMTMATGLFSTSEGLFYGAGWSFLGAQVFGALVVGAWAALCSFRADPCDNQVGEMEVDGVGLYGQQVETTQEIVKHQEV